MAKPTMLIAIDGTIGAGKTTLMSCIGGKHLVGEENVRVLGSPAFHDTTLAQRVALLTGNWTQTVAFVDSVTGQVSEQVYGVPVDVDPPFKRKRSFGADRFDD